MRASSLRINSRTKTKTLSVILEILKILIQNPSCKRPKPPAETSQPNIREIQKSLKSVIQNPRLKAHPKTKTFQILFFLIHTLADIQIIDNWKMNYENAKNVI